MRPGVSASCCHGRGTGPSAQPASRRTGTGVRREPRGPRTANRAFSTCSGWVHSSCKTIYDRDWRLRCSAGGPGLCSHPGKAMFVSTLLRIDYQNRDMQCNLGIQAAVQGIDKSSTLHKAKKKKKDKHMSHRSAIHRVTYIITLPHSPHSPLRSDPPCPLSCTHETLKHTRNRHITSKGIRTRHTYLIDSRTAPTLNRNSRPVSIAVNANQYLPNYNPHPSSLRCLTAQPRHSDPAPLPAPAARCSPRPAPL